MKRLTTSQSRVLTPCILLGTIISVSIVLTASADLTNCTPPPAGLVSWWHGEGTADDSVGGASGTLYDGVTFAPGRVGQCFAFNGVSGGVNVPDIPALALTNSLTIECWLFVTNAPSVPGMVLDSSLAAQVWGWKPQTPLEAIWSEIADHAEKNPGWLDATAD